MAIYSGRPDPVWTVHPSHHQFKKMKEHLDDATAKGKTYRHDYIPACPGFKGVLVHHPEDKHGACIVGQETAALQRLLLDTMSEGVISDALRQKILEAIDLGALSPNVPGAMARALQPSPKVLSKRKKADVGVIQHYAPELNLGRWNNYSLIRLNNNCYNYANNTITNSFAQPGCASGSYPYSMTPESVLQAAQSDGLVKMDVSSTEPPPEAPVQPNCLVALVVAKGKKIQSILPIVLFYLLKKNHENGGSIRFI